MPASPQQYLMGNMIKQKTVGTKNGTLFWYNVTMDMNAKATVGPGVEVEPGALCLSVRVSLPDPTQTNHFLTTFVSRLVMTGFLFLTGRRDSCNEPPKISHAVIIHQYKEVFSAGSEVQYECEEGYTREGNNIICEHGQWTAGPTCSKCVKNSFYFFSPF